MSNEITIPSLDNTLLQEKVNEFAMKGAIESIKEYYTGYNSPFRTAITEHLQSQSIGGIVELPDIIAALNESLSKEIDEITNTAVAKSFVPLVSKFLCREEKEIDFSDILKEFIKETDQKDPYECECNVETHEKYEWLSVTISGNEADYELTLHMDYISNKEGKKKYKILTLPCSGRNSNKYSPTMKISLDGATLEMPFTSGVLGDPFTSFIARLVLSGSLITMDTKEFDEDMFDKECHCD
jgi:hypothetical protein